MNTQFINYLSLLESVATPSDRAAINSIRGQYAKMEASFLSRDTPVVSVASAQASTRNAAAKPVKMSDREKKKVAANKEAAAKRKDTLSRTINSELKDVADYAKIEPAKIDAWVDHVLTPAIDIGKNANKANELNDGDTEKQFASAKEQELAALKDADAAEADKNLKKQTKLNNLKKANNKKWDIKNQKTPFTPEQKAQIEKDFGVKKDDGEKKEGMLAKAGKKASGFFHKLFASDMRAARAAFESVYGDSSKFSDEQIAMICESVYRRTH